MYLYILLIEALFQLHSDLQSYNFVCSKYNAYPFSRSNEDGTPSSDTNERKLRGTGGQDSDMDNIDVEKPENDTRNQNESLQSTSKPVRYRSHDFHFSHNSKNYTGISVTGKL